MLEIINLYRDKWCVKGTRFADSEHRVTDYTGLLKYSTRAGARLLANYDRNERKETRRNESRNSEFEYAFANRLEVRLSFATKEIMFNAFARNDEQAHSMITNRLEAILFIVDLDEVVECSAYLMRSF